MERCERHEELVEYLDDHEDRIKYLELNDVEIRVELKNLICTVRELVTWIKGAIVAMIMGGASFIIWYIQNGV